MRPPLVTDFLRLQCCVSKRGWSLGGTSGHGRLGAPPNVRVAAVSSTAEPQWPRPHGATPLFRHITNTCRGPMGSSIANLVAAVACRHPTISAHVPHVSRTHREHHRRPPVATVAWGLHRRCEWLRLAPPPNPSGRGRMAPPRYFGTSLTRAAALWGAQSQT